MDIYKLWPVVEMTYSDIFVTSFDKFHVMFIVPGDEIFQL